MRLLFPLFLITSLFGCGLDQITIFPDEYVSDQFTIFGTADRYALGAEVSLTMHMRDGETRPASIEITGTALRIDETDAEGVLHATAVEAGSGEIIYTLGGEEVRRYPFEVATIATIAVEHFGVDGEAGFVIEGGTFDVSDFSIAMGTPYGVRVRYEDAEGNELEGAGLLSADASFPEDLTTYDAIRLDTTAPGESTVVLSAGDVDVNLTYDVVDALASLELELDTEVDGTVAIWPRATDSQGRRVYGKPDWRVDGEVHELFVLGFGFDTGFVAFERSETMRHVVEAELLGTLASIEAGFVYESP